MTSLLFCVHLDTLLAEKNLYLGFCACVFLKKLLTFSSFLVKVVIVSYFFMTWHQVFLKLLMSGFSRY